MVHGSQQNVNLELNRNTEEHANMLDNRDHFIFFFFQPNSVKGDSGARNTVT